MNKYIIFNKNIITPLNKITYIKGVKYKISNESCDDYILCIKGKPVYFVSKSLENKEYKIGKIIEVK